jgi:hypothetical protein
MPRVPLWPRLTDEGEAYFKIDPEASGQLKQSAYYCKSNVSISSALPLFLFLFDVRPVSPVSESYALWRGHGDLEGRS